MTTLIEKSKALIRLVQPLELFTVMLVSFFSWNIFSVDKSDLSLLVLGTMSWCFVSASASIIKSYYEVKVYKLAGTASEILGKQLTLIEAMAYYIYFTISAMILAAFIHSAALYIIIFATVVNYLNIKKIKLRSIAYIVFNSIIYVFIILYYAFLLDRMDSMLNPVMIIFLTSFLISLIAETVQYELQPEDNGHFSDKFFSPNNIKALVTIISIVIVFVSVHFFLQKKFSIEFFVLTMAFCNPIIVFVLKEIRLNYGDTKKIQLIYLLKFTIILFMSAIYFGTL